MSFADRSVRCKNSSTKYFPQAMVSAGIQQPLQESGMDIFRILDSQDLERVEFGQLGSCHLLQTRQSGAIVGEVRGSTDN